jgi:putative restriction endonuclease
MKASAPRYWWVNHQHAWRQEIDGEYLWSPKTNQNGTSNETYTSLTRVMPGDVVFSFADAAIRAVGVALGRAREAPQPRERRAAGKQSRAEPGWQLPVRFTQLKSVLRPQEHTSELTPLLPKKRSPIDESGDANRRVYLAAVPELMAARLRELLGGQVEELVARISASSGGALEDERAEAELQLRTDIGPTEKLELVRARSGQGVYRTNLERVELGCRMTGLLDRRHLRASHIKPWCVCTDREKLDGFNGLLLSPHVGHLFDRGYFSFSDSGDVLVAQSLNPEVLQSWCVALPRNVGLFRAEQCRYLEHHRREVFQQKLAGGMRSNQFATRDVLVPVVGPSTLSGEG